MYEGCVIQPFYVRLILENRSKMINPENPNQATKKGCNNKSRKKITNYDFEMFKMTLDYRKIKIYPAVIAAYSVCPKSQKEMKYSTVVAT